MLFCQRLQQIVCSNSVGLAVCAALWEHMAAALLIEDAEHATSLAAVPCVAAFD